MTSNWHRSTARGLALALVLLLCPVPALAEAAKEEPGPFSCERFRALLDLRSGPELQAMLKWMNQLLALFRIPPAEDEAPMALAELQDALKRYCILHPEGNVTDGLFELLDPERDSLPEGVLSVQGPDAPLPRPAPPRPSS